MYNQIKPFILLTSTFALFSILFCFDKAFSHEVTVASLSNVSFNLSSPSGGGSKGQQEADWRIYLKKSKEFFQNREIDEAIEWAKKADSIFVLENKKPLYDAQALMGICYKDKDELVKSIKHYQLALANAPGLSSEINTMLNMAEVSLAAKDTIAVLDYLSIYRIQLDKIESRKARAYCYFQYASLLQKAGGDLNVAFSFFQKSLSICRIDSIYEIGSYNCCGIIELYEQQGKIDSCLAWQDSLAFFVEKDNSPLVHANALQCLGNFNLKQKNYKTAIKELRRALIYARKADYMPACLDIFMKLSEASEAIGDYKKSIFYLKKYDTIEDSLGASKWNERLLELQMKYENERKEQQLKTLKNRLDVALGFPVLIAVFSVFVIIFLVLFLTRKQYNPKQVAEDIVKSPPLEKSLSASQLKQWDDLQRIFIADKLYLKPDLTLTSLAKLLNTNRSTLSEIINIKSGKTFTHFVNEYRVKEACILLSDPQKNYLSIEGIGLEVGFNSRSAFYVAFAHEIEQSPASFRKTHSQK
nr:AraC family transcriptional regulator [uncultured Draconibacterium sp.]